MGCNVCVYPAKTAPLEGLRVECGHPEPVRDRQRAARDRRSRCGRVNIHHSPEPGRPKCPAAGTCQDSARTTSAGDGEPVGGWADRSGAGHRVAAACLIARSLTHPPQLLCLPREREHRFSPFLRYLRDASSGRNIGFVQCFVQGVENPLEPPYG